MDIQTILVTDALEHHPVFWKIKAPEIAVTPSLTMNLY